MLSPMLTPCMSNPSKVLNSQTIDGFHLDEAFMMNNDIPDKDIDMNVDWYSTHWFLSVPPDPQGPDIDAQSCSLVYQASVLRKIFPNQLKYSLNSKLFQEFATIVLNTNIYHFHSAQCHTSCSKQLNHHHQCNSDTTNATIISWRSVSSRPCCNTCNCGDRLQFTNHINSEI